jgi:hypothetical protein
MYQPVADTLVVTFTYGVSLRTWLDTGGIGREMALYIALADHYDKILFLTYGGAGESKILADALPAELQSKFRVVSNESKLDCSEFAATAPALILAALDGAKRVVVKTNQMAGGDVAVKIADHLLAAGIQTGLVARGGYLWSRMAAYEYGPTSCEARKAAEVERALCTAANVVVGTTKAMIDDLAWRYTLDPSMTRLIPNYVIAPSDPPRSAAERIPGLILYAGQLVHRKRVDVLIEAVSQLEPELRETVTLEIIGDGPELENLKAQAAPLGKCVVFRSRLPHEQLLVRMSECSLYAQASELEGHPKTVLEAMAQGATVLIANTPGLGEVVMHGISGLRLSLDAESFSRAFTELLNDSDWRDSIGSGAARMINSTIGLDATIPKELESHAFALATPRLELRRCA